MWHPGVDMEVHSCSCTDGFKDITVTLFNVCHPQHPSVYYKHEIYTQYNLYLYYKKPSGATQPVLTGFEPNWLLGNNDNILTKNIRTIRRPNHSAVNINNIYNKLKKCFLCFFCKSTNATHANVKKKPYYVSIQHKQY